MSIGNLYTPNSSVRQHVDRKIWRFSICIGLLGAVVAGVFYFIPSIDLLNKSEEMNRRALAEIKCNGSSCDTSLYTTDWWHEGPDYLVDAQTGYFVDSPSSQQEDSSGFYQLDFADVRFLRTFHEPQSYTTPDGEIWRLYSKGGKIGDRSVEIMVGFAQKAPWKILITSPSELRSVDAELRRQANAMNDNALRSPAELSARRLPADGFLIADAETAQVIAWGPWLPMFFARDKHLPYPGRRILYSDGQLRAVRVDGNGRFLAISLIRLGSLWWLICLVITAFLVMVMLTRTLSRRFLRHYFAVTNVRIPSLEEACQSGESQTVEFKRGLSEDESRASNAEDELLKSVAAFANTSGGVIYVGIDDSGKIKGLGFDLRQRDRFERKIRQLARSRIKPSPPLEVSFSEVRGLLVARIVVARGEDLAYLLNGVIYVRVGSSDVQAQPEDLRRLVSAYAS